MRSGVGQVNVWYRTVVLHLVRFHFTCLDFFLFVEILLYLYIAITSDSHLKKVQGCRSLYWWCCVLSLVMNHHHEITILLVNTLWVIAWIYYVYITFLGYSGMYYLNMTFLNINTFSYVYTMQLIQLIYGLDTWTELCQNLSQKWEKGDQCADYTPPYPSFLICI